MGGVPISDNYRFLNLTGGTRSIGKIGYPPAVGSIETGTFSSGVTAVNLEDKTGTHNQSVILPGGVQTYVANKLDFRS